MALRLMIRGVVQGVGFRWFARQEAHALGISGWVKNHADGAVEIAADGDAEALERFRARVTQGPPGARVESVQAVEGEVDDTPLPKPFAVRR
jgi:acylphosphatase